MVAPSTAFRRRSKTDPWFKTMTICVHLNLYGTTDDAECANFQAMFDDSARSAMADYFVDKITQVAKSPDRRLACRLWVINEARCYAPLRSVFTAQDSYRLEVLSGLRHPCTFGLFEEIDRVIEATFPHEVEKLGTIAAVRENLRKESVWASKRLELANTGRTALEDIDQTENTNWLRTYVNALVAVAETDTRTAIDWPVSCSSGSLKAEVELIEKCLLEGKADPLEYWLNRDQSGDSTESSPT